jgi:hypothetical protein
MSLGFHILFPKHAYRGCKNEGSTAHIPFYQFSFPIKPNLTCEKPNTSEPWRISQPPRLCFAGSAILILRHWLELGFRQILQTPLDDPPKKFAQPFPFLRQTIVNPPSITRVLFPSHVTQILKQPQARGQNVRCNPFRRRQKLVETRLAPYQVPHHEEGPTVSHKIKCACHRTVRSPIPHSLDSALYLHDARLMSS